MRGEHSCKDYCSNAPNTCTPVQNSSCVLVHFTARLHGLLRAKFVAPIAEERGYIEEIMGVIATPKKITTVQVRHATAHQSPCMLTPLTRRSTCVSFVRALDVLHSCTSQAAVAELNSSPTQAEGTSPKNRWTMGVIATPKKITTAQVRHATAHQSPPC